MAEKATQRQLEAAESPNPDPNHNPNHNPNPLLIETSPPPRHELKQASLSSGARQPHAMALEVSSSTFEILGTFARFFA